MRWIGSQLDTHIGIVRMLRAGLGSRVKECVRVVAVNLMIILDIVGKGVSK